MAKKPIVTDAVSCTFHERPVMNQYECTAFRGTEETKLGEFDAVYLGSMDVTGDKFSFEAIKDRSLSCRKIYSEKTLKCTTVKE